ncbi:MAG: hypothetical protein K8R60_09780 [Burkholderiales bacterium]|nr:hypothetical protein [Burkholderiales bacterium]
MTEADVTVRDGRVVRVRAVSPADEAELLQKFERSSEDARSSDGATGPGRVFGKHHDSTGTTSSGR